MTLVLPIRAGREASAWRDHGVALGIVAAALLALFAGDAAAVASTWWTSTTFGHCLLVPPILAWLVWERRRELARLIPTGWWPGLWVVAFGTLMWLVGQAGAVTALRQFGLLVMLQGAVVTLLGPVRRPRLRFPRSATPFSSCRSASGSSRRCRRSRCG